MLRSSRNFELLTFDFDGGPPPTNQADWCPEDSLSAVLSTCPSLLAVVKVGSSEIIHISVKEFLISTRLAEAKDITSRYHVSMIPAHTIMTQACLGILLHLDEKVPGDCLWNFPLATYAVKYWVDHAGFARTMARNVSLTRERHILRSGSGYII